MRKPYQSPGRMKNSSYYIAPVGDWTHDLPHSVASNIGKVSHALNHSATEAVIKEISIRHERRKACWRRRLIDVYIFFCTSLFKMYSPICIVTKLKIFFNEYEMVRATIVTLITSVDRVRTPECHCVPRWKNKFCSAEKIALLRISSAIGRWHHNNSRDQ